MNDAKKITLDVSNKTKNIAVNTKDKVMIKLDKNGDGQIISQEDVSKILDGVYANVLNGLGKASPSIEQFAQDYLEKASESSIAAKNMIKN